MVASAKRLLDRIVSMQQLPWDIWMGSLILSCVLVFCAFLLMLEEPSGLSGKYDTYRCVWELVRLPQLVLLLGILASVCAEDYILRHSASSASRVVRMLSTSSRAFGDRCSGRSMRRSSSCRFSALPGRPDRPRA